jgi:rhomboid protease GluP
MAMTLLVLLVLGGYALYVMSPEERTRLFRAVMPALRDLKVAATHRRPECEAFREAMRARTRWALVTPALIALNVTVFIVMLRGGGVLSDPETLVGWGGNFGPRTTNGEWWRLVASMFVHSGMLQLLVNAATLLQIGLILERLVGRLAFATVYITAGIFAGLMSLSAYPVAVSAGASGAIFGLYGLLLASLIWGRFHRSAVTIPPHTLKRLAPAAAAFILYSMANDGLAFSAEITGLVAGFLSGAVVWGLVLASGARDRTPDPRWVAGAMAATVVIAVASAVPLRGIADVKPEMERVVALEDRTSRAYATAAEGFRKGRITADALARLIDRTIMPELQAADARVKAFDRVPPEHQPLVADAEEYLRLRAESWRLRAEGLRRMNAPRPREAGGTDWEAGARSRLRAETQHNVDGLLRGRAEGTERASLEVLQRIKPVDQKLTLAGDRQP